LFQEIEKGRWPAAARRPGLIQGKVAAVRAEREKAVARRKDALPETASFGYVETTGRWMLEMRRFFLLPTPLGGGSGLGGREV